MLSNARQAAEGHEAAYDKGIAHNLKPANIAFTPGGIVQVLDFGFADVFARSRALDI